MNDDRLKDFLSVFGDVLMKNAPTNAAVMMRVGHGGV